MVSTLRFSAALLATNLKTCLALRGAFWVGLVFMALNNFVFFTMWWIFFDRFEEVRGWRLADMALLFGVVACAFGLVVVVCGGVRELASRITNGDLDALLVQPRSPLLQAVGSRSWAAGCGDVVSGACLIAWSGLLRPEAVPLAVVAVASSATVFLSAGILFASSAFWLGRVENLSNQVWEFLILFSTYPNALFTGPFRLVLYTVMPAAFVGHLPVELVRNFSWGVLGATVGGAAAFATLASFVFERGLRRYTSGNRIGLAA